MIKVIEHGYKKYRTTCHNCECYFEYEITDVDSKGVVKCPDCEHDCYRVILTGESLASRPLLCSIISRRASFWCSSTKAI